MAEETTQNATPEVAKELVQHEFWVSGMLNGQFVECDGPYYTTKDIPKDNYPYTTTQPNPNFTSQKYDYINHKWVDTSSEALLHIVEDVQKAVTELKSNSQSNDELDKKLDKLTTLVTMSNVQTGKLMQEVQDLKKQAQPAAQPTETTQTTTTADEGGNK